ncbi:hypothetical protein ACVR05_10980 [Streptococcus caprae]|uniref:Uncharacterized protein n=1 Tax=Streptococcus caprae TaxID=1640501 RepID=A0ABV8CTK7_9STRE
MILLIPDGSFLTIPLSNSVINNGFEPVLYSLDELQDTSFQVALKSHSQTHIQLYTSKMTALYFGYRKKDEKGKYRVYPRNVAEKLAEGSQNVPLVP